MSNQPHFDLDDDIEKTGGQSVGFQVPRTKTLPRTITIQDDTNPGASNALKRYSSIGPQRVDTASRIVGEFR
jgi:hypothetical protein